MSSSFLPNLSQPNSTYLWLQTFPSLHPSPFYFQCSPLKAFPQLALLLFHQTSSASTLISASIFWHCPHMPRLTGGSFLLIRWSKTFCWNNNLPNGLQMHYCHCVSVFCSFWHQWRHRTGPPTPSLSLKCFLCWLLLMLLTIPLRSTQIFS